MPIFHASSYLRISLFEIDIYDTFPQPLSLQSNHRFDCLTYFSALVFGPA